MLFFQSVRVKMPKWISYWMFPLISGIAWLVTLITLLIYYHATGKPRYLSMEDGQTIPYISDIGATELMPVFITGSIVTTLFISFTLALERFLRHRGRLAGNQTILEKVLAGMGIFFAVAGGAGLVLLSIFDCLRHKTLHQIFLVQFLGCFILSSICGCWEYQMLGKNFRELPALRISYLLKLTFIILEGTLIIAFGIMIATKSFNTSVVLEWILAFVFSFYVFSFIPDLLPAVYTKQSSTAGVDEDVEKQNSERAALMRHLGQGE